MKIPYTTFFLVCLFVFNTSFAYDFQKIDEHSRNAPEKVAKDVESLTAYLIKPAKNDIEKVRSFFVWISENIAYDVQAYQTFNPAKISGTTPNDVLKKRKAVCQGYAELFNEMCRLANIKSYLVPGYSKGFGYQPGNKTFTNADHAWNAVYLEGKWHVLDATWGSGGVNNQLKYVKQFNEKYFLSDPQEFIKDHMPQEPAWQLLDCPVSMKAFIAGEETIKHELAKNTGKCNNYNQLIATWEALPDNEKALHSATNAYTFNPENHQVMARGYIDYANFIMKSIKPEMRSKKEIEEGVTLQEQALVYLKKAEALLKKVKDNSADMEKEFLRKNIQLSEQNLSNMKKVLKG